MSGLRLMLGDELKRTLEIGERGLRIDDYLRQSRGFAALGFATSRVSQACTSVDR